MPLAQGVTNNAAGATNANVLQGSNVEFINRPSKVRVYACGNAAGENRVTFKIGTREVMGESPVSRQNRVPMVPDDLLLEDVGMPGERLTLAYRNTGAGAVDLFWRVEVIPVA